MTNRGKRARIPAPVRLQKLIAEAGVASRRAAERLIVEGHVTVNGEVVRELGAAAVPGRDEVRVDGALLRPPTAKTYLVLNKPSGFVTSVSDPHAERTVMSLLPRSLPRVYPVGRLDRESEGLLLLTDDGELTERLLHPRFGVEREYAVLVRGDISATAVEQLRRGVVVEGTKVVPVSVVVTLPPPPISGPNLPGTRWLRIVLTEGRKREVRVMAAAVHWHVIRLIRIRFGPLELGDLPLAKSRRLTEEEVASLKDAVGERPRPARGKSAGGEVAARPASPTRGASGRTAVRRDEQPADAGHAPLARAGAQRQRSGTPHAGKTATRPRRAPDGRGDGGDQRVSSTGKRPSRASRPN